MSIKDNLFKEEMANLFKVSLLKMISMILIKDIIKRKRVYDMSNTNRRKRVRDGGIAIDVWMILYGLLFMNLL